MPGSKCKMPSELNGLHIRHEFRGKVEIACSCAGPSWLQQRKKYMLALSEGQPAFMYVLGGAGRRLKVKEEAAHS